MIGVVTTSYPRSPEDGAGVFVRERVLALRGSGHAVEVLAAGDGADVADLDPDVTRIAGAGLFYSGGAPEVLEDPRLGARLFAWGRAARFTLTLLGQVAARGARWDTVESHWLVPCGLVVAAALPGRPHRAHVHGGDLHVLERLPGGDSLSRTLCKTGPGLVFASQQLRDRFCTLLGLPPESLGAHCHIEAAPINAALFRRREGDTRQRLRDRLGIDKPVVLAAGRLVPIKGFDVLLAALADLAPAKRPRLVVAGDGPERRSLARLAQSLGVRMELLGNVGQDTLADWMAAADLFVHPCRTLPNGRAEGMPLAVREALASGLPVIASASGGLRELEGTPGLSLVPSDDPRALAAAILRVVHGDG